MTGPARIALRSRLTATALAAALAALMGLALAVGDYPVAPLAVLRALAAPLTGVQDPGTGFIVLQLRLPRALLAILAGCAFALGGAIFQTLLRNPLASPDLVGIAHGASAAAVAAMLLIGWRGAALSAAALAGAMAAAGIIYLLARRGGAHPYRLVLIGLAVAAVCKALIAYLFTLAQLLDVQQALIWLTGSLNGADYRRLAPLALAMAVLVPWVMLAGRALSVLQLGDDAARALGSRVGRTRLALMACAVALVAFATAAAGPVAFVAFLSAPIARRMLRSGREGPVTVMLVGGIIMLGSDLIAQHALAAAQLPVGVVTGAFGASFLLWLLWDAGRRGCGA